MKKYIILSLSIFCLPLHAYDKNKLPLHEAMKHTMVSNLLQQEVTQNSHLSSVEKNIILTCISKNNVPFLSLQDCLLLTQPQDDLDMKYLNLSQINNNALDNIRKKGVWVQNKGYSHKPLTHSPFE